jgi:hypothetical protein
VLLPEYKTAAGEHGNNPQESVPSANSLLLSSTSSAAVNMSSGARIEESKSDPRGGKGKEVFMGNGIGPQSARPCDSKIPKTLHNDEGLVLPTGGGDTAVDNVEEHGLRDPLSPKIQSAKPSTSELWIRMAEEMQGDAFNVKFGELLKNLEARLLALRSQKAKASAKPLQSHTSLSSWKTSSRKDSPWSIEQPTVLGSRRAARNCTSCSETA